MPIGPWANFDACLKHMESGEGYSSESAHKVCGSLKEKLEKGDHPLVNPKDAAHYHKKEDPFSKWRKNTNAPVPVPEYERPDKCADNVCLTHEEDIKKDPIEKDAQTRPNPDRPLLSLDYDPSVKAKRSQRVYDGQGMPKDIRRGHTEQWTKASTGEIIGDLDKGNWKMYVKPEDKKKIPAVILEDRDTSPKPPRQIRKECPCEGQKIEMEHSDTLKAAGVPESEISAVAKKIASDHVGEIPDYYERLKRMEKPDFWEHFKKADDPTNTPQIKEEESEIRQLRIRSKLSPGMKDLKEVREVKKDDIEKEWTLNLDELLKSEREFSGTFHKPVIDRENDIIPASAMDRAMDDFMVLPTLQEVHTERTVGIVTKAWKTGDDGYYLEGKIKPGDDCDDVWQKIKKGEYDGLSIGGRRVKYSKECAIPSLIRDTPCVTHRLKLYNVSVCSSPVNPEASIDDVNKVAKGEVIYDLGAVEETLKKSMTTEGNLSHGIYDGKRKKMDEEIEKSDESLITKSDIAELTKAIQDLEKSFASHFSALTKPQPQKIGGKGHSVKNTMQKGEEEEEEEEEKEKGYAKVKKAEDVPKDDIETLKKAYDDRIAALEDKLKEQTVIRKGGDAVVIPEQLAKDDPILTNMSMFGKMGRMAK